MSYSCSDLSDDLDIVLSQKGYVIHCGNAETGETVEDESGADYWFTWMASGMAEAEVGEYVASSYLEAQSAAMVHFFENAHIPLHPLPMPGPADDAANGALQ